MDVLLKLKRNRRIIISYVVVLVTCKFHNNVNVNPFDLSVWLKTEGKSSCLSPSRYFVGRSHFSYKFISKFAPAMPCLLAFMLDVIWTSSHSNSHFHIHIPHFSLPHPFFLFAFTTQLYVHFLLRYFRTLTLHKYNFSLLFLFLSLLFSSLVLLY